MKRAELIVIMLLGVVFSASAQHDDLYFVPKKKVKTEVKNNASANSGSGDKREASPVQSGDKALSITTVPAKSLDMDEDAYNRRGSYLTEQGDAVSEFAMNDDGFVLITEDGDTMWMDTDTLRLARVAESKGWVNGFDGSDTDYEYAMRIIRFRNPRYAIPVSSPLYWDVVYGSALWPGWDWNIYDDGMYAYVFPTSSNRYYWDYMMSYPFGWTSWSDPWVHHHGMYWGHHWGSYHGWQFYGHVWYDPWFNPYFHDYHPGWHVGHHHHHNHHPGFAAGKPGGGGPIARPNHRTATGTATRRDDNGSVRNSSARVIAGNSSSRTSGAVRSSSSRTGNDEQVRRPASRPSVSRSSASGSSSRSNYTRQSTSRSSSGTSSYNRPSSTRSSSSSVSRSSSSGSSRSSGYSGSSRSSYSSGSSSRSSYSSGSSHSSYSSGSSRSSSSYSSGSSSRSSGSRR